MCDWYAYRDVLYSRTYLFIEWAAWIMLKFSSKEPFALNILDPKNVDL